MNEIEEVLRVDKEARLAAEDEVRRMKKVVDKTIVECEEVKVQSKTDSNHSSRSRDDKIEKVLDIVACFHRLVES